MDQTKNARYLLTAGLVIVFSAFGLWKFTDPIRWISWIPLWMDGMFGLTRDTWLTVFGAFELLLAIGLLLPQKRFKQLAAALMMLHLVAVLTQTGWNDT